MNNNEKDVKPSERVEQLMDKQFKNFPANNREEYLCVRLQAVVDYLDEQAEQHAKKSEECKHISGGLGACPKCGTPYDKCYDQPSPSSEPCKHEWAKVFYPNTMKLLRYDCMKCDESKPAEQPKENEVEELAKIMHKGIRGHCFTWEEDYSTEQNRWIECSKIVIKAGYSKLPQKDVLSVIDIEHILRQEARRNLSSTVTADLDYKKVFEHQAQSVHQALVKEE